MKLDRLLEIAAERAMCDLCCDCEDVACLACAKVKGVTGEELREYHTAVRAALRKAAEDDKAREEGRLVGLPIPVGEGALVYGIREDEDITAHIVTIDCDRLDGLEVWPTGEIVVRVDGWEIGSSDIGKTVFLTRQEAEAALDGGGEGG